MSMSPALRDLWEDVTQTHNSGSPERTLGTVLEGVPDPTEGQEEQGTPDDQNRADVGEGCIDLEMPELL